MDKTGERFDQTIPRGNRLKMRDRWRISPADGSRKSIILEKPIKNSRRLGDSMHDL